MQFQELADFWREQSEHDIETAEWLYKGKRYAPSLFFTHLAIEKALKSLVVEATKEPAPYTHDLVTLADAAELPLDEEKKDFLRLVNTFNIRARYDDYKQDFYRRASAAYAKKHLDAACAFLTWLNQHDK